VSQYTAQSLEVLSGLDPVRRRPGMYTDTTRPNHLAQEVIDNAVDEALAGHANKITVTVYKDGSLSVEDNGRGMPVDIHPEYGQSGIEIILTKLQVVSISVLYQPSRSRSSASRQPLPNGL
jgi:topoisomerase-4 subunit B